MRDKTYSKIYKRRKGDGQRLSNHFHYAIDIYYRGTYAKTLSFDSVTEAENFKKEVLR